MELIKYETLLGEPGYHVFIGEIQVGYITLKHGIGSYLGFVTEKLKRIEADDLREIARTVDELNNNQNK